jgi:hypothetical protein
MNDLYNTAWKFTAKEALELTQSSNEASEKVNIDAYVEIIQRIMDAASLGRQMIRLSVHSYLEKQATTGTINKLKSAGFKVEKAYIRHCVTDSDYLGIDISW